MDSLESPRDKKGSEKLMLVNNISINKEINSPTDHNIGMDASVLVKNYSTESLEFDQPIPQTTLVNRDNGEALISDYVEKLKAETDKKNNDAYLDDQNIPHAEIQENNFASTPASLKKFLKVFNSNRKSIEKQDESKSTLDKTSPEAHTGEQLNRGLDFFKNIASNIQSGIKNLKLTKLISEEDMSKYQDISNLNVDNLWDEIFVEVDKVDIDME
jgi:hypothetical protein